MEIGIGLICTVLGIIISYFTFYKNSRKDLKKDTREETERNIRLEVKLDNISNSVNEIRLEQKDTMKVISGLHERLLVVEESNKQAHKRIDKIECDNNDK